MQNPAIMNMHISRIDRIWANLLFGIKINLQTTIIAAHFILFLL
jgi:hypothetical protein